MTVMRRRRVEQPDRSGQLPPELAVCWIEDWLEPGDEARIRGRLAAYVEAPVMSAEDRVVAERESVTMSLSLTAWRRWRAARREWAAAHGVDVRGLPRPSGGRPRWRVVADR